MPLLLLVATLTIDRLRLFGLSAQPEKIIPSQETR